MILSDQPETAYQSFDDEDIFHRKIIAVGLENIFRSTSKPICVGLEGSWGSGKTWFLHKFSDYLRSRGTTVVHINAFESDYQQDAFFVIAASILAEANKRGVEASVRLEFKRRFARVARATARISGRIAVKAATAGLVSATDGDEVISAVFAQSGAEAEKLLEQALEAGAQEEETVALFKKSLADLSSSTPEDGSTSVGKTIVIIDELDRCKPSFALELLECVKHFFATEGVHFLLGYDPAALSALAGVQYGDKELGRRYVSKFVNFTFRLNWRDSLVGEAYLSEYCRIKLESLEIGSHHPSAIETACETFSALALASNLALRDVNRLLSNFSVISRFHRFSDSRLDVPIIVLIVIRYVKPDLYAAAKTRSVSYKDVKDSLFGSYTSENYSFGYADEVLRALLLPLDEMTPVQKDLREHWELRNISIRQRNALGYFCQVIDEAWQSLPR